MYNNFPFPQNYANPSGTQGFNLPGFNPPGFNASNFAGQRYEIIRVHGREGAEVFSMQPNMEVLLLDDSQPVVWHKKTDGAGYATLNGYSISPLKTETQKEDTRYEDFNKRLSALEDKINAKPDTTEFANVEYQTGNKNDKGRR